MVDHIGPDNLTPDAVRLDPDKMRMAGPPKRTCHSFLQRGDLVVYRER